MTDRGSGPGCRSRRARVELPAGAAPIDPGHGITCVGLFVFLVIQTQTWRRARWPSPHQLDAVGARVSEEDS